MLIHERYNKDGAKVLVEKGNLEVFKKLGYKFKTKPECEVKEVVVEATAEDVPAEKVEEVVVDSSEEEAKAKAEAEAKAAKAKKAKEVRAKKAKAAKEAKAKEEKDIIL